MATNWDLFETTFRNALQEHGSDATFSLRSGEVFTIKASQGHRSDVALTDGIDQNTLRVRVSSADWEAVAPMGRSPEKGDKFEMWGRKQTVDRVHPRGAANRVMVYVLFVRG